MLSTDGLDEDDTTLVNNINEHGWYGLWVFDPKGELPDFTYTIGFEHSLGCPNFIIFGLPKEAAHGILWNIYQDIGSGVKPAHGMLWNEVLGGELQCCSIEVSENNYDLDYFGWGTHFHKNIMKLDKPYKAFQIVWPDSQNRLPWQNGFEERFLDMQPILGSPP